MDDKEVKNEEPQYEEVKPAQEFQEVEIKKKEKEVRTDSYFDGGLLELIGWRLLAFLITAVTLGIANPWAQCMLYSWQFKHTVYNGKRLKFEGTGGDLFVNIFKWIFFTIITLGIYSFLIPVRKARWVVSNLHYEDEEFVKGESFFDGKTIQLIGVNLLCKFLTVISLGLLFPFTVCYRLRWYNKHSVINRKKLVFSGKAINLWGKYLLWWFLTIITFGIFALWLPIKMLKWQTKNTHIMKVGEEVPKDRSFLIIIPILAIGIIIFVSVVSFVLSLSLSYLDFMTLKIKGIELMKYDHYVDDAKDEMAGYLYKQRLQGKISIDEENALKEKYDLVGVTSLYERENCTLDEIERMENGERWYYIREEREYNRISQEVKKSSAIAKTETKTAAKKNFNAGGYTVTYGTYKGRDYLFDWEEQKEIPVDIEIRITENYIVVDGQQKSYSVSGNQIYVDGYALIEVTNHNTLRYLAQSCPTLLHAGY